MRKKWSERENGAGVTGMNVNDSRLPCAQIPQCLCSLFKTFLLSSPVTSSESAPEGLMCEVCISVSMNYSVKCHL